MRDIVIPDFVVYISMAIAFVAVMGTILSDRITDWIIARRDRKEAAAKAAAEAEAAAAKSV